MTIHLVKYGLVACMREMPPAKWPDDHFWSSDPKDVTCEWCLKGMEEPFTFEIWDKPTAIHCRICGATSYNDGDIKHHYCAWCHTFHDDLWPLCRAALIGHPERVGAKPFPAAGPSLVGSRHKR